MHRNRSESQMHATRVITDWIAFLQPAVPSSRAEGDDPRCGLCRYINRNLSRNRLVNVLLDGVPQSGNSWRALLHCCTAALLHSWQVAVHKILNGRYFPSLVSKSNFQANRTKRMAAIGVANASWISPAIHATVQCTPELPVREQSSETECRIRYQIPSVGREEKSMVG